MKLFRLVLFQMFLLFIRISLSAQPNIQWEKTFGGNSYDALSSVLLTNEGYILLGHTKSFGAGSDDLWLLSITVSGDTIWTNTIGWEDTEVSANLVKDFDEGYTIFGSFKKYLGGFWNVFLVGSNEIGRMEWASIHDWTGGFYTSVYDGIMHPDGGYLVISAFERDGVLNSDWDNWLIRTNSNGDTIWTKNYGGDGNDFCSDIKISHEGGIIMGGGEKGNGDSHYDWWLLKTDISGNIDWQKVWGSVKDEWINEIYKITDGYIIAGITRSYGHGKTDGWLRKIDKEGNSIWDKTFGGSEDDYINDVIQTTDGGYIFIGSTKSFGEGDYDYWINRLDSEGNIIWSETYGGEDWDAARFVILSEENSYLIGGETYSQGSGDSDAWLIKLKTNNDNLINQNYNLITRNFYLKQNYPNPFNSLTKIKYSIPNESNVILSVYSLNGRLIKTLVEDHKKAGCYEEKWNATNLPTGIYIYRIETKNYVSAKKCILLR